MMRRAILLALVAGLGWAQAPAPAKPQAAPPPPPYKALKFPPLRQVAIPEVATFTLPNGMKLYLLENHTLPLVNGLALVRTGNLFEPADKIGLAGMTGSVLRTGGAKRMTGDELDERLENIAASVESSIGETMGSVSFNMLKENTDEVLALFKEILTTPEFRQDKIDLIKTQYRSSISRRNDDAGGIASREFSEILYGRNTPYGRRMEYEHVERIQREDLIAFYRRYYFPANVMLAVQGDITIAEMKAKIEKLFADWTVSQPAAPAFPALQTNPQPGVYLATKVDVTQTFFSIGHLGGLLKDKDYPALEVMGDILGGGFSSRLFKLVRTEKGYAYNIGGGWGADYLHPGLFRISGSTKSASTAATLELIRQEIERIRAGEVTDQELATAKDTVLNGFVFNFDHPSKTLSRLMRYEYYGYPRDFIFQYQKAIAGVTKADVLRVAKQYLQPDRLVIVAAGNPAEFGTPLSSLKLPISNIDLTIPEPKKAAVADAASLAKGKQLLQRAQQAMGGADKLAAIKDYYHSADVELQTGQAALKIQQVNQWIAPAHFRQDQTLPFGKVIVYFDGTAGWLASPQGVSAMPPPVVRQVKEELFRNPVTLYLSDRAADRTVNAVGDNAIEISDKEGNSVTITFDPQSGLPAVQTRRTSGPSGPTELQDVMEDWRDAGGLKVPFHITVMQGGKKFADARIGEVKLNSGLKVEELSKKP